MPDRGKNPCVGTPTLPTHGGNCFGCLWEFARVNGSLLGIYVDLKTYVGVYGNSWVNMSMRVFIWEFIWESMGGGGAMDIGPKPVKSHVDPGISEVPFFPRTDIEKDFSTME